MVTQNLANLRNLDPFFVGFDRFFRQLESLDRVDAFTRPQSYPPYNIRSLDDDRYQIELAIAGFTEDDLDVVYQDSKITVKGDMEKEDGETGSILHRGIANRHFTRQFTLADTIEVEGAELKNGMLIISLKNIIPDSKKPRQIKIAAGGQTIEGKKELLTEE
jgi:molecular chaperone IbpA